MDLHRRLRIGPDAMWIIPPDHHDRLRIERRSARRMLAALCVRRRASEALTLDELVAIGWPGERMHPRSAANRVYVSIAALRRCGLRDVVRSDRGGYWLARDVEIQHVDPTGRPLEVTHEAA